MKKTGTGQIGNSQIPVPFMFVGEEMTFIILWTSPFCPFSLSYNFLPMIYGFCII